MNIEDIIKDEKLMIKYIDFTFKWLGRDKALYNWWIHQEKYIRIDAIEYKERLIKRQNNFDVRIEEVMEFKAREDMKKLNRQLKKKNTELKKRLKI